MGKVKQLILPPHYKEENAKKSNFRPDQAALYNSALEWRKQNQIKPADAFVKKVSLLIIDAQRDFCFPPPDGALFVGGRSGTGAMNDNARLAEFIYRNLGAITEIITTLDTHFAYQIFFPVFWLDENGNYPEPMTMITGDDIRAGKYRPNPIVASWVCSGNYGWLLKQVEFYCDELEKAGKYTLTIWPPHCMLGSDGHTLAGIIHEARLFHDFILGTQSKCEIKGGHPLTENYSVFRPEVLTRWDGKPLAQKNTKFLKTLFDSDAVIIAGQAKSHCVAWTIRDLLNEIKAEDPKLVEKVYLIEDCTSPVVIPGVVDFIDEADKAFDDFANAGMHVVKSKDPIEDWPDVKL